MQDIVEKNDSFFYHKFWYFAVLIKGFLNKINSETGHSFFVIINMTTKMNLQFNEDEVSDVLLNKSKEFK